MKKRLAFLSPLILRALCVFAALAPGAALAGFSTVVIDAGHGGFDRGGIPGQRIAESTMTLDVARRLRARLRDAGLRTVMTRDSDVFIPLPERVAIANAQRNAVFVSIHFNAAPRAEGAGFETYFYNPRAAALAVRLYSQLCRAWPTENRGLRQRGFYVIRKTAIPSVLCECGFLTNPREGRLILQSSTRQRIADLLARAIIEQSGRRGSGGGTLLAENESPATTQSLPEETASTAATKPFYPAASQSSHHVSSQSSHSSKRATKKAKSSKSAQSRHRQAAKKKHKTT